MQHLSQQFWSRWRRDFIAGITLRGQWHRQRQVIHIVILKVVEVPCSEWKLVKVLFMCKDDNVFVKKTTIDLQIRERTLGKREMPSVVECPIQKLDTFVEHD